MSNPLPTEELDAVLAVLRASPNGATLTEIARRLPGVPEERRLERWMEMLMEAQLVIPSRFGRHRLYRAVRPLASAPDVVEVAAPLRDSA